MPEDLDFVDWENWLLRFDFDRLCSFESEEAKLDAYSDYLMGCEG